MVKAIINKGFLFRLVRGRVFTINDMAAICYLRKRGVKKTFFVLLNTTHFNKSVKMYHSYLICFFVFLPVCCNLIPRLKLISTVAIITSAKLNATVNANRLQTEAWFEWGTASGGPYPNASPKRTLSGETNRKYGYKAQELTKRTTYYYRAVAENEDGISHGDEMSFKTKR